MKINFKSLKIYTHIVFALYTVVSFMPVTPNIVHPQRGNRATRDRTEDLYNKTISRMSQIASAL